MCGSWDRRHSAPFQQIDFKICGNQTNTERVHCHFVITRITEGRQKTLLVSRIPLLEQDLQIKLRYIKKGDRRKNGVKRDHFTHHAFRAFCGQSVMLKGLVHISEFHGSAANDLANSFSPGQKVECVIVGIEQKEPLRLFKNKLSLKQISATLDRGIGSFPTRAVG